MNGFTSDPGCMASDLSPCRILTSREREVAAFITRGTPNKIIAAELGISQRTIEAHRARIFLKLGVRNAVELTKQCLRWSLAVHPPVTLTLSEPDAGLSCNISAPDSSVPVVPTARRWDRCRPGVSGAIPAAAPGRSTAAAARRSTE